MLDTNHSQDKSLDKRLKSASSDLAPFDVGFSASILQ